MQLSTNGLILFDSDEQFESHTISSFPRRSRPLLPLVAPLWADFNFRDSGSILYRLATDNRTLTVVADIIGDLNGNYLDFTPTWAVVVTWLQSRLLRRDADVSFIVLLV